MVLLCHVTQSLLRTTLFSEFGSIGVTIFFTLSGFLITALLLEERDQWLRTDLTAFFLRRARRLFPALFVYIGIVSAVAAVLGSEIATRKDVLAALLYVGNWEMTQSHYMGALNHTWSLSVEEQFYVVWPLVLIAIVSSCGELVLLFVSVLGAAASVATSGLLWLSIGADRVYFGSDTRASALLIGCALAVLMRRGSAGMSLPRFALALVCLLGVLGFDVDPATRYLLVPPLAAAVTAAIIYCVVRGEYSGWFSGRAVTWLGRRSYGLYLWHVLVLAVVTRTELVPAIAMTLALAASVGLAILSWRYVESPFLRRRSRPGLVAPATAGVCAVSLPRSLEEIAAGEVSPST